MKNFFYPLQTLRIFLIIVLATLTGGISNRLQAQNGAQLSGNLQSNGNFFIEDAAIGATGTPQYDYQKFGAESWLTLQYSYAGFEAGVRFDLFNHSNLLNPVGSYTDEGIGRWFLQKKIGKFDLAGGYLYDQIGSGIIFRAYEERALMIDNALVGVRAGYQLAPNWRVKAFTGRQKRQFERYGSILRGAVVEGFVQPDSTKNISFAPGFGAVARTFDDATVDRIVSAIASYAPQDSTGAQYNTYAFTLYNTLTINNWSWYAEGAFKTNDVLFNEFAPKATGGNGKLVNTDGYTIYSSLAYAGSGLGATLEFKRTDNFRFRADPFQVGVQGQVNFLPPLARQNTFRLTARFAPNTQELGEQGIQFDLRYKLNKKLSVGLNVADIRQLDGTLLYREVAPEITWKEKRKWQVLAGLQTLRYNMGVYQLKDSMVRAVTPYVEVIHRFTPKRSLRVEAQYLGTREEFGSWTFLLAEVGLAPHWLIFASDMYKIPHRNGPAFGREKTRFDGLHYPSVGAAYTHNTYRMALSYVKQVEGINCAGGICRYEPTFHGVRLQLNASF
jgi:Family of unknown function (DUF6029)